MSFKRTLSRLTAGLLLAVFMVSPALAATGTVNTPGSSLRLRAGAGTNTAILTNLPHNTQLDLLEDQANNGWYHVTYKGMVGYVSADYFIVSEVSSEPDVPDIPVSPSDTPADETDDSLYIKVLRGPLNVRTGPGTGYERVGRLSTGRTVKVLDSLDGWYQIEAGYVCGDYVREMDAAEALKPDKGQEIADYALQFLGYRYVYGGSSPETGFDCSGFTTYIYKQFGYGLYRTASDQLQNGAAVSRDELLPGDLVLFRKNTSNPASHVGLYIGNGQFIHAATTTVGVIISSLSENYWSTGFVGGRRIV